MMAEQDSAGGGHGNTFDHMSIDLEELAVAEVILIRMLEVLA